MKEEMGKRRALGMGLEELFNTEMLDLYWNIGKTIMEIQQGDERATYGETVLEKLSQRLTNEFGKGFSIINLRRMRKFYCLFPPSGLRVLKVLN